MALTLTDARQFVDRKTLAVRHPDYHGSWKNATEHLTPGHDFVHDEPVFQVFDPDFLKILGPNPSVRRITEIKDYMFAHEAPVWSPETDEVFFSSRAGNVPGISDIDHNNMVSKFNLGEVARAIEVAGPGAPPVHVSVTQVWLFYASTL